MNHGMPKETHEKHLRKLRDYIKQNRDLFNSMQFHKLYESRNGEHDMFFPELNAYITKILYTNNISPFNDPKFTHIPVGFASEFFHIPQLQNITDKTFNNLKVTVGYAAFDRSESIESIDTSCIEAIHPYGFCDCHELERVQLRGDNIVIERGAFSNCYRLKYFELDATNSWEISMRAFEECDSLQEIRISGKIGQGQFTDLMDAVRHPYKLVISAKTAKNMNNGYKNALRRTAEGCDFCTLIIED